MNTITKGVSVIIFACTIICFTSMITVESLNKPTPVPFTTPKNWPEPTYNFENNPLTKEGIALGRQLFYDPLLSSDSTISCADCHLSRTAFTHTDHDLSHGIKGRIGLRNSPAIINPAWATSFMWDGGVNHLDMQPLNPLQNPDEMDNSLENILDYLESSPKYDSLFKKAFGNESEISISLGLKALSQFMLQFNSYDSKYDRVMRNEPETTFTASEQNGYVLFQTHCSSCHPEPLFTNNGFKSNGLSIDTTLNDYGRVQVTDVASDSLLFKVPTLRNIEVTYPYMHDGRYRNLAMVMFHYSDGLDSTTAVSKELSGRLHLSPEQKRDLINFLKTLTDESFLRRPELAFPRN